MCVLDKERNRVGVFVCMCVHACMCVLDKERNSVFASRILTVPVAQSIAGSVSNQLQ